MEQISTQDTMERIAAALEGINLSLSILAAATAREVGQNFRGINELANVATDQAERLAPCPECDGSGVWAMDPTGPAPSVETCPKCGGTGNA